MNGEGCRMSETKLIVTNRCNLNCSYCYEKNKSNEKMSKQVVIGILDSIIESSQPKGKIDLSFHGGEPLLEFELIKFATKYLKEGGKNKNLDYRFSLTTNGTLVNEDIANYFFENNFRVKVSLDGKEDTHNLNRKTIDNKNTYNKVIKAIHLLNDKKCNLSIRMTVTPKTVDKFVENVRWLREEGFMDISAIPDSFADWSGKYEELEDAYSKIEKDYIDSLDKSRFYFSMFDGKISQYIQTCEPRFCNAGFGHFVINPDGNLYPCAYVIDNKEFCLGKIEGNIDKKKRCDTFSKYIVKDDKCKKCSIAHFCQGRKCSFNNYISTGYLNLSDEFWCIHENILYKIIGEIVDELCKKQDSTIMKMLDCIKTNPQIIPNKTVIKYL